MDPRGKCARKEERERYEQVINLFQSGQSQGAISRTLGIQRKTIRRWLRRGEFPERKVAFRVLAPRANDREAVFASGT
jgi:DNA invertase Pin-like site-specific DNA recombinase